MSGLVSTPMRSGYCASKHAVSGFFNSLQYEVDDKITITQICPNTFSGSNFRANAVTGESKAADDKRSSIFSVEDAAELTVSASDRQMRQLIFPSNYVFAQHGVAMFPSLFAPLIRAQSKL